MNNLAKLEKYLTSLGWYSGKSNLTISIEGQFEGYSGRASDTWEYQTIIALKEVKNSNIIIIPYMKFTSRGKETIEQVTGRMISTLIDWILDYEFEHSTKEEVILYIENAGWIQCYNDNNWVHSQDNRPNPHFQGLSLKSTFKIVKKDEYQENKHPLMA